MPAAKTYGDAAGRFSFNVSAKQGGGRCEACEGAGVREVEMHFLPNVFVTCEVCKGKRYNDATLRVTYKDKNIAQMLDTPIDEARELFRHHKQLGRIMQTLVDVGLGYCALRQPATTLSGGEAQRVKLAASWRACRPARTLYLLDEPTTGLHFGDVKKLLEVLGRLVAAATRCSSIEHNLDVIETVDWIIIRAGRRCGGGEIIAAGTPSKSRRSRRSDTGQHVRPLLERAKKLRGAGGGNGARAAKARAAEASP